MRTGTKIKATSVAIAARANRGERGDTPDRPNDRLTRQPYQERAATNCTKDALWRACVNRAKAVQDCIHHLRR